jgi:hypothetical protein
VKPCAGLFSVVMLTAGCANLPYNTAGQIPGTANPGTDPGGRKAGDTRTSPTIRRIRRRP